MSNRRARGRTGSRPTPWSAAAAAFALAMAWVPAARAQVGHPPSASPFQDVTTRQELTFFAGRFGGNPAEAGIGARPGLIAGVRFTTRLSGPLDLTASFAGINSSRYVIDPDSPLTSRTSGPIGHDMIAADLGMGFNLTGRKTWRGFAPYVGMAIGIAVPTNGTTDPGGYEARQNFTFVPSFGTRVSLSRSLGLQIEARDYFMRYEYPLRYFEPATTVPPVLDPAKYDQRDMTSNWAFTLGLSYRFSF